MPTFGFRAWELVVYDEKNTRFEKPQASVFSFQITVGNGVYMIKYEKEKDNNGKNAKKKEK
jgi:hypothetical protein